MCTHTWNQQNRSFHIERHYKFDGKPPLGSWYSFLFNWGNFFPGCCRYTKSTTCAMRYVMCVQDTRASNAIHWKIFKEKYINLFASVQHNNKKRNEMIMISSFNKKNFFSFFLGFYFVRLCMTTCNYIQCEFFITNAVFFITIHF